MFHAVVRVLLKLFEVIGCIACVITKNLTDQEARRIQLRNQKYSREWSLLSNVTWSREGNAFASVTYGGYTLITALLLISRCINSRSRPTLTEKIFLTVGMLFFFTIGSLVYASIEQVQPDLHDNALILGTLSYLVAILFLIDLADPMERTTNRSTQTLDNDLSFHNNQNSIQQNSASALANIQSHIDYQNRSSNGNINKNIDNNKDLNVTSIHRVDLTPIPSPEIETIPRNGYYFPGDQVDIVQTKTLPVREQPIFAKVLLPEKKRPIKEKIIRPIRLYNEEYRENYIPAPNNDDRFYRADARTHYINTNKNNNNYCLNSYKNNEYPGPLPEKDYFTDDDNIDRPLKSGFVAQAARMWDKRAKRTTRREQNTIV